MIEARTIDGHLFVKVADVAYRIRDRAAELTDDYPDAALELLRVADQLTLSALEHVTTDPGDSPCPCRPPRATRRAAALARIKRAPR